MNISQQSFRYSTAGLWLKGNTHIHTPASDGGTPPDEVARMYCGAGYDFLFRTDHWAAPEWDQLADPAPILWLSGVELDGADATGSYYHVVCLGALRGITREVGFIPALKSAREQGAIVVLAHPYWTGNSLEDALRLDFDGVEIYNHLCRWLNGKSDSGTHWDAMLKAKPGTIAFASDDAHLRPEHPGWNGGWIMVNAPDCTAASIMGAIRRGNFYSSCGPDFHAIEFDGTSVRVRTSPVQFVRIVGPGNLGERLGSFNGSLMTEASMPVPADWTYAYLEIEDAQGRRAWTNGLFGE